MQGQPIQAGNQPFTPFYGVLQTDEQVFLKPQNGFNPNVAPFPPAPSPQRNYQRPIQARKLPPSPAKKQIPFPQSPQENYQKPIQARKLPPPPAKKQVPSPQSPQGSQGFLQNNAYTPSTPKVPSVHVEKKLPPKPRLKDGMDPNAARMASIAAVRTRTTEMLYNLIVVLNEERGRIVERALAPNRTEEFIVKIVDEISGKSGDYTELEVMFRPNFIEEVQRSYQQKLQKYLSNPNFLRSLKFLLGLSYSVMKNTDFKEGNIGEMISFFSNLEKKPIQECTILKYAVLLQAISIYEDESKGVESEFNRRIGILYTYASYLVNS